VVDKLEAGRRKKSTCGRRNRAIAEDAAVPVFSVGRKFE
jgi:hypothetical protein